MEQTATRHHKIHWTRHSGRKIYVAKDKQTNRQTPIKGHGADSNQTLLLLLHLSPKLPLFERFGETFVFRSSSLKGETVETTNWGGHQRLSHPHQFDLRCHRHWAWSHLYHLPEWSFITSIGHVTLFCKLVLVLDIWRVKLESSFVFWKPKQIFFTFKIRNKCAGPMK